MIKENKSEFDKLNITYWWSKGFTGKGTNIVVLDVTGKPFERDNIIEPLRYIDDAKGYDSDGGHKTMVCAVLREILPEANIYAFRWSGGYKDKIIDWIREHEKEIDVINCSFEGKVGADEFARLKDLDIAVMGAMGNDSKPYANDTSTYDFVTGIIAWVEYNDKKASYSNYGLHADFACYSHIKYISPNNGRIVDFSGTSCASPVASSLVALYSEHFRKVNNRKMTRQEVFEMMLKNVDDKETPGRDDLSGYGLFRLPSEIPTIEEEDTMKFKDTNGHWADGAIDFISDKGLLKGYEDGTFKPERAVTRAELATVLARQNGYVEKK